MLERETPVAMCQGAQVYGKRKPWRAGNDEGARKLEDSLISFGR